MIEVHRDTRETISLTIEEDVERVEPDNGIVSINVWAKSPIFLLKYDVAYDDPYEFGRYLYNLPEITTGYDRNLLIEWLYSLNGVQFVKKQTVSVVTPYVTVEELQQDFPEFQDKKEEELVAMERRVRMIINSFTGQNFGKSKETLSTYGSGTQNLNLPKPVISIDNVYPANSNAWDSSGFPVMPNSPIIVPLRDTYGIKFDGNRSYRFVDGQKYYVEGIFGYEDVPQEITEAAKMLISDMFCKDSIYRKKGINAVTSSDWRLDYSDRAMAGTGNLDVDRILSSFVSVRLLVL